MKISVVSENTPTKLRKITTKYRNYTFVGHIWLRRLRNSYFVCPSLTGLAKNISLLILFEFAQKSLLITVFLLSKAPRPGYLQKNNHTLYWNCAYVSKVQGGSKIQISKRSENWWIIPPSFLMEISGISSTISLLEGSQWCRDCQMVRAVSGNLNFRAKDFSHPSWILRF